MKKHLVKAFFRINKYSALLTFIFTFILQNFIFDHGRMRNCYIPLLTEILFSIFSLFISLASATLFLNLFKRIIQNSTFSLLSFIFLPLLTSIILTFFLADQSETYILLYIAALLCPVWVLILWEYFKFNSIKKNLETTANTPKP
jgi:predicted neutral ceramidase superfamily lipid hydrolase